MHYYFITEGVVPEDLPDLRDGEPPLPFLSDVFASGQEGGDEEGRTKVGGYVGIMDLVRGLS